MRDQDKADKNRRPYRRVRAGVERSGAKRRTGPLQLKEIALDGAPWGKVDFAKAGPFRVIPGKMGLILGEKLPF